LAREQNSHCLYYKWCVNPLDCIVKLLLLVTLFLGRAFVFGLSGRF
jgi:hypothetical protein